MRKERTIKTIKKMSNYCLNNLGCIKGFCPYQSFCDKCLSVTGRLPNDTEYDPEWVYTKLSSN